MLGKVQINNLNLIQGTLPSVENYFLYVGGGDKNVGSLVTLNQSTDLDAVLGTGSLDLKTQVEHARLNAGQNWSACVLPLAESQTWQDAVDYAMQFTSVESVVLTDPVASVAEVENMQAKAEAVMAKYMRPLFVQGRAPAFDPATHTWSSYQALLSPIIQSVAADQVLITPSIWGYELGALAGRLSNQGVTIADSPMRVKTGPLLGNWLTKPKDKDGRVLDRSVLEALDRLRYSVPQWYPDYPGMYFGDGNVLDVPGGDFQAVENLRVIQKCMRKVYPLAVARIADRSLNQYPWSIAAAQSYFMRPLREMSHACKILGHVFPGEIEKPKDGDITIHWPEKYAVEIYMAARPYNSPKKITCNLLLDLKNHGTGSE